MLAKTKPRNPVRFAMAQRNYERSLTGVSRHIGELVHGVIQGENWLEAVPTIRQLLEAYAEALVPWANSVGSRMLGAVNVSNLRAWRVLSGGISIQLRHDIMNTQVGTRLRELLGEQVHLIKSIPITAAERVHKLGVEALMDSRRYTELAKEIERSGEVSKSHAILIARTETARTSTALLQVRAEAAGSTHFRWRTAGDSDVRPDHKILNGQVFAWNDPPIADRHSGARALPGAIFNCRCFPEPLLNSNR